MNRLIFIRNSMSKMNIKKVMAWLEKVRTVTDQRCSIANF